MPEETAVSTAAMKKAILDEAITWWSGLRPAGWDVRMHVAEPTVGINDDRLHALAKVVAARVDAGLQRPTSSRANGRSRQPEPGAGEMLCGRCGDVKPIDEFDMRADRPGRRHTICTPCRLTRQNARYLSVSKAAALEEARIAFVVDEADEVIGLRCATCDKPFRTGDHVLGDLAEPVHDSCPRP